MFLKITRHTFILILKVFMYIITINHETTLKTLTNVQL